SARIRSKLEQNVFDQVVKGLTQPGASGSTAARGSRNPAEIVFSGSLDEVDAFFVERDWSDGLPFVPPTIERVERFLAFTDRAPDESVGVLPAANLRAVPLNIAANAVMA